PSESAPNSLAVRVRASPGHRPDHLRGSRMGVGRCLGNRTPCFTARIPADCSAAIRYPAMRSRPVRDRMHFRQRKRRDFITLLGGAALAWPLAARAQQVGRLPTIGLLGVGTASGWVYFTGAFVQRLRELGWIEGRTVAIEYRWAEGRRERFSEIAAEFVGLKVDVIVTGGDAAAAAKQVTPVIPIVFALGLDPLGSGLVANLARPGGNVTGISFQSVDIAGKRVELLHEIVPQLRRLAILANVGNPQSVLEMGAAQAAARMLGLEVSTFEFRRSEDIVPAFDALNGRVDAIYVCGDALVYINRNRINTLSVGLRLPTMHLAREFIEAGGLMAYGPSMQAQFRRAAQPLTNHSQFDIVNSGWLAGTVHVDSIERRL